VKRAPWILSAGADAGGEVRREGKSWDQFQDLIDVTLMQAAIRQHCEFGGGRSAGRRDPAAFR